MAIFLHRRNDNSQPDGIDLLLSDRVVRFLKRITDTKGGIQAQTALVLFYVATHNGCSVGDIADENNMSYASASRNVAALSAWHRLGKSGMGYLTAEEDPAERRRKQVTLTAKGWAAVGEMLAGLEA